MDNQNNKKCGCICHEEKHQIESGLIHDTLCCDKMSGSLELSGVLKERQRICEIIKEYDEQHYKDCLDPPACDVVLMAGDLIKAIKAKK